MTCYYPLLAYKDDFGKVVFNKPAAYRSGFNLPCGQCVGCRLKNSRDWAVRCIHEAQMHQENCFITLTFSPEALAERDNPYSVEMRDFQLFMKRLRKKFGKNIRFFHVGEYGEKNRRPHYHALLFGFNFPDKELFTKSRGISLYTSKELQKLWPFGFSTIGDVTFESAAYCARYCLKKINGEQKEEHYKYICAETGEIITINQEYATMSRGNNYHPDDPRKTWGLGHSWFQKFKTDVFPHDYVVIRKNLKVSPPNYYLELLSEEERGVIKKKRIENSGPVIDKYDENMDRLWVKEACKQETLKQLLRKLDQ